MDTPIVLLADSDERRRHALGERLRGAGCRVTETQPEEFASACVRHSPAVAVVCATSTNAGPVLERIRELRHRDRRAAVILTASQGSEELAVAALRAGVADYFREPFPIDHLVARVRDVLAAQSSEGHKPPPLSTSLLGGSAAMQEVRSRIARLAGQDVTVLISGETGTGKELAAALLHAGSRRRRHRLISINCAAIPESLLESELFGHERGAFTGAAVPRAGLLQQAQGGTVFFDEIGEMSAVAQAKVLRAIEAREVMPLGARAGVPLDVRVVAATNQDLERAMSEGRFRKDLYYRLNVVRLHLPPLRERASDIPGLLAHYVAHFRARTGERVPGFSRDALSRLQAYAWPGNVRELKNLVEAVFANPPAAEVRVSDLPSDFVRRLGHLAATPDAERERVLHALFEARWNKSLAARHLRCSRMTLYRKLARLKLLDSDAVGRDGRGR